MKVLELNQVNKIYNSSELKVYAVNEVSITFEEGEFAAIVGPSGSGKTTLLNLIGGLDSPTSGEILIDGTDLSQLKPSQLIAASPGTSSCSACTSKTLALSFSRIT